MRRQPFRAAEGGHLIDRSEPLRFDFDGHRLEGYRGDSLASGLLAGGVRIVARSFKYHRPRGVWGFGPEEPNAMVATGVRDEARPNLKATEIPLTDGLKAFGQNAWPSVAWDLTGAVGLVGGILPAGFYYKTFMWPARWWHGLYEPLIRRMAGFGPAPAAPDDAFYAKRRSHADVLVAGGGPAGVAAALAAARAGARGVLADENVRFGGDLLRAPGEIDGGDGLAWIDAAVSELEAMSHVRLLSRATVAGYYDHNLLTVVERAGEDAEPGAPATRLWFVRAREVVIAAGAHERPLLFAGNDRPGVMSASAAGGYVHAYGVLAGRRAVVAGNNDSIYSVARRLRGAGASIAAVADTRSGSAARDLPCRADRAVERVFGSRRVRGVLLRRAGGKAGDRGERIACDLVAVSGGWSPAVHLHAQARGSLSYDEERGLILPDKAGGANRSAGAAGGRFDLDGCLADGWTAGIAAAASAGHERPAGEPPRSPDRSAHEAPVFWQMGAGKRFVDLQYDVTVADVELAAREGYRSVEHVKRYTALGMGTDQGKTSGMAGLVLLSEALGRSVAQTGTTTFRPPYTPVPMAAMAAGLMGEGRDALRRTAADDWHEARGAPFTAAGHWRRPRYYPREGMDEQEAIEAEVRETRAGVGIVDVGTLGKVDVQGRDAAAFLDLIYANRMSSLKVGRGRYGLMLREDGRVFDDGVVMRLGENHFYLTTTTAHHHSAMQHMEFLLQTVWPELEVYATDVSEHWFACALAGPGSRALLGEAAPDLDVSDEAFPMMAVHAATVADLPALVFRMSYSGELSYEIAVPAEYGLALWTRMLTAGRGHGLTPYGTEAMGVMRIEKGHVTHAEADGRTTPDDLGLGRMVGADGRGIGKRSLDLPALRRKGRQQLVGLSVIDAQARIPPGCQVAESDDMKPAPPLGHVTSFCYSPTLGRALALALVENGRARTGQTVYIASPVTDLAMAAEVVSPVFYDAQGTRLRG
ncbi:MAG: sarcosine oxidase subunit alpha family protein [Alphaproteobacteria bacterium]|nr:sarcosine oxidase subunit alpha family protein [Alphaproteobacteria bacterium]